MALAPRPTPFKTITEKQLQPGDVLLSCGAEALSQLICKVDGGGKYSHAALWDGHKVVEATGSGVTRRYLTEDMKEQWYIDAYRWHRMWPPQEVLGDPPYLYGPVIDQADKIERERTNFAYDELVMSALVIWVSQQPRERWLRIAVRLLLGRVEAWLHDRVFTKPGQHSMVCTEVVSTSFWEAVTSPDYAIYVLMDGSRDSRSITAAAGGPGAVPPRPDSDYDELKWRYGQLYLKASAGMDPRQLAAFAFALSQARFGPAPPVQAGGPSLPSGCVTPRDLERSPSLEFVGRISEKSGPVVSGTRLGILLSLVWNAVKVRLKRCLGISGGA